MDWNHLPIERSLFIKVRNSRKLREIEGNRLFFYFISFSFFLLTSAFSLFPLHFLPLLTTSYYFLLFPLYFLPSPHDLISSTCCCCYFWSACCTPHGKIKCIRWSQKFTPCVGYLRHDVLLPHDGIKIRSCWNCKRYASMSKYRPCCNYCLLLPWRSTKSISMVMLSGGCDWTRRIEYWVTNFS